MTKRLVAASVAETAEPTPATNPNPSTADKDDLTSRREVIEKLQIDMVIRSELTRMGVGTKDIDLLTTKFDIGI